MDHPGDRGELVRAGPEGQRQAGQGELGVVVAAQDQVVEPLVVGAGQVLGACWVLPRPLGEALGEFGGLLLGGQRRVRVGDVAVASRGVHEVADLDLALFQDRLGELRRGVAFGAPGGGGQHAVGLPRTAQTCAAGMLHLQPGVIEDLARGTAARSRRRSRRRRAGRRSRRAQVAGITARSAAALASNRGSSSAACWAARSLSRTFPDRYSAAGTSRPVCGSSKTSVPRSSRAWSSLTPEQPGDLVQPGFAAGVQADRQRVRRGVGAQPRRARGDDPAGEDGGLRGALPGRVELLQRVHQRRERVAAEPALRGRDARHDRLAGGRVGAAGPAQREPVQRPVSPDVLVIVAGQLSAQAFGIAGCRRGELASACSRRNGGVAQPQQCAQLSGLGAGHLERPVAVPSATSVNVPSARASRCHPGAATPGACWRPVAGRCRGAVQVRPRARALAVMRSRPRGEGCDGVPGRGDGQVVGPVGAAGRAQLRRAPSRGGRGSTR